MFGYEGLGCIYWHMVSKLLLAVQENFFTAIDDGAEHEVCRRLGALYYRVRDGIGFNKTPAEYPGLPDRSVFAYAGARRRPAARDDRAGQGRGLDPIRRTGSACRRRRGPSSSIRDCCARASSDPRPVIFRFLDVHGQWQSLTLPESALAFTWCQVPIVYQLRDTVRPALTISLQDGREQVLP